MRLNQMPKWRADLIIRLGGGRTSPLDCDPRALRIIHALEHYSFRDALYKWLIRRGITGKLLVEYNYNVGGTPRIADAFAESMKVLNDYGHGGFLEKPIRSSKA